MVKALGELILPNDGLGLGELVHLDGDDILELLDELRDISSFVVLVAGLLIAPVLDDDVADALRPHVLQEVAVHVPLTLLSFLDELLGGLQEPLLLILLHQLNANNLTDPRHFAQNLL